jgi:glycosyltransferase involved in cell wall biosynthesis
VKFGVSVYIPNRNHAATLGAAIYSAAREQPVEVAVIDDASTDNSVAVANAAAMAYDCVWLHEHQQKSACWEQAAASQFGYLGGSHVIGLSADDELHPGVIQSTMRYPQAAVVFHPYYCRKPGKAPHAAVPMPFDCIKPMTPGEACMHLTSDALPCETGIGSAIHHSWLAWLCHHEYWRMGPWADAVGYSSVAALGGCVYSPEPGAIFTEDDAGYGFTRRNGPDASRFMVEVWAFLKRAEVPQDVAAAICRKRGVDA